jgi:hypothetical protein
MRRSTAHVEHPSMGTSLAAVPVFHGGPWPAEARFAPQCTNYPIDWCKTMLGLQQTNGESYREQLSTQEARPRHYAAQQRSPTTTRNRRCSVIQSGMARLRATPFAQAAPPVLSRGAIRWRDDQAAVNGFRPVRSTTPTLPQVARYTEEKDEGEGKPTPWFYRWAETVEERKPSPDNSPRAPPGCYPDGAQIPSRSTPRDLRGIGELLAPNQRERRR